MPVSLLHPHRSTVPPASTIVRRSARCCAVCGTARCHDAEACRRDFGTIEWLECPDCAGSGYDTTGFRIFCPVCRGAKVLEVEIVEALAVSE